MRGPILLACLAISLSALPGRAVEFPYTAYVSSDDVYVRSGPGKNYYPTAKLKRGEQVEVYRHDPGGWYAIRPPRQSFSWVSARQLDPAEKGLAVINAPRSVARVGSLFSDMRDVIQVRLNQGEKVELLESQPVADGKWYKIAPPAGEFRWIHKEYLDRHPMRDELADDERRDARGSDRAADDEEDDAQPAPPRRKRRPQGDIQLTSGEPTEDEVDDRSPTAARQPRPRDDADTPRARRRPSETREDTQKSFALSIADIDLDLSAMVAEEIGVWSFADLRARTARLIDRAPTALERGQARMMMSKIDRFAELKERHDTIIRVRAETTRRNRSLGATELVRHEESVGPRFDAVGRLTPNAPRNDNAPPYVLLDAAGRVVTYVTPAPSINLRSYIDKQVGINGQRGYIAELHTPHLNAQHVTVLPAVRR